MIKAAGRTILARSLIDVRARLLLLVAVAILTIGVGGFLLRLVSETRTLTQSLYLAYALFLRVPGMGAIQKSEPITAAIFLNILFLFR
jgi:hypothetical protein